MFSIFEELGISVDSVATSEVSISLTLDPSKIWSRELIQQASCLFFHFIGFDSVKIRSSKIKIILGSEWSFNFSRVDYWAMHVLASAGTGSRCGGIGEDLCGPSSSG